MTIQWMPKEYTERRPKTSYLIGQALGETLGKASDLYLQNKIQGYFDTKKSEADKAERAPAAKKMAALFPDIRGADEIFARTSEQNWPSMMEKMTKISVGRMNLGGDLNGLIKTVGLGQDQGVEGGIAQATEPQTAQAPTPTPASQAVNLAAMQRAGAGMGMPYAPGTPEFAQAQQPQGQYAQPQEQTQAQMPEGPQEPEKPMGGPLTAGNMPEDQFQLLKSRVQPAVAEALDKERKSQIGQKASLARIENTALNKEKFEYLKKTDERDYKFKKQQAKGKNRKDAIDRADKNTKAFREDIMAKESSLVQRQNALDVTRDAVVRGEMGPMSLAHIGSLFGMYGEDASQMLSGVKTSIIADLAPISGRQNVYLEQMMAGSFPQIGKTKQGNLIALDVAKSKLDLDRAYVESYNEVYDKYQKDPKWGYFPEKAVEDVKDVLKQKLETIRKNTFYNLQEDREFGMTIDDLAKNIKQETPTVLTKNRRKAILGRAERELARATGKPPTRDEAVMYADQLINENNYFRIK